MRVQGWWVEGGVEGRDVNEWTGAETLYHRDDALL